ncbi:hypothetical protein P152DRAFT_454002 [Eremomyces bilateralis CBS 781.70]|uniref:Uncharacterized protein n=1 Tax=Eremomyces bilateralis CBS 781.70 TaxID=1392243 RepID=A0A6G1GH67_9PEZI|nr:uncharacterized protein P152DRAFT_454002 [Eremomyces bilateralis CBS 781.70]KAF1817418.1 hypothetical protein P152DRAFT_454002 [Eremomyces bilateralis CBS 781.70]
MSAPTNTNTGTSAPDADPAAAPHQPASPAPMNLAPNPDQSADIDNKLDTPEAPLASPGKPGEKAAEAPKK